MKSATVFQAEKNAIRKYLLKNKDVPKESEVRFHLGSQLAKVFFGSLDHTGKEYLALIPPNIGPHTCLLMPDSDTSIGQFELKAPLNSRAVTHCDILDIGRGCLLKYENQLQSKQGKALVDLEASIRAEEAKNLAAAVEETRREEKEIYEKKHMELMDRFEKILFIAVNNVVKTLERECDKRVQRDCAELDKMLRDVFEYKMSTTIETLQESYKEDTLHRLENQRNQFYSYLKYIQQVTTQLLREIEMHHMDALQKLRNDLETANMADICYVTARERKSCQEEKRKIWQKYDETVARFNRLIEEKEMHITVAKLEVMKGKSEASVWQEKVEEILNEFQKFVTFALKCLPEHSAFLIDRRKLLETVNAKIRGVACRKVADALENLFSAVMDRISAKDREEESLKAEEELRLMEQKQRENADEVLQLIPSAIATELSEAQRKEREEVAKFVSNEINNLLTIFRKHPSMASLIAKPADSK